MKHKTRQEQRQKQRQEVRTLLPASVVHVRRTYLAATAVKASSLSVALSAHVPDFTVVNDEPDVLTAICTNVGC